MLNPSAYFDSLALCVRLQQRLTEPSEFEIHLFGYLSCLLWLYRGEPISAWGYSFTVTHQAFPFSAEMHDGIQMLQDSGMLLAQDQMYFHVTHHGQQEYDELRSLSVMHEHEPYLDGACSSLLTLPLGLVREALLREPGVGPAIALSQTRALFAEGDVDRIYEQFVALSTTIGVDVEDLMIPAIVWIRYLTEAQKLQG